LIFKETLWITKFHWFVTSDNYLPLSEQALCEAGNFAVCHSSAWASKMVTTAYWVHVNQVSKTAPSGENLVTGSFVVRGKKNFLSPSSFEMGLGQPKIGRGG